MQQLRLIVTAVTLALCLAAGRTVSSRPAVVIERLPDGGLQPQAAVDQHGTIHLVYFRGDPPHGDAFYIQSHDGGTSFSKPIRVNSTPGSAIGMGTVRGAQIAVGRSGRVHVAWNGSRPTASGATPMFYTHLNDAGTAFEPQRNVMRNAYNIDGGGAVASDRNGRVFVVWHANAPGEREEGKRRVWIARSADDGQTFERERAVFDEPTGACGCCGLGAFADRSGSIFVLFRSAFDVVHRDIYLLMSRDSAASFTGTKIDEWNVGACVMSTQALAEGPSGVYTAWETEGQIFMGRIDAAAGKVTRTWAVPGAPRTRRHPALAVNGQGDVLLAWTEGTAWNKGGSAAWQVIGASGLPIGEPEHAGGVPTWGLVAAYARPDGGFGLAF